MINFDLAKTHPHIAGHPNTIAPEPALRNGALTVYDPVHMPPQHSKATSLRDQILTALKG